MLTMYSSEVSNPKINKPPPPVPPRPAKSVVQEALAKSRFNHCGDSKTSDRSAPPLPNNRLLVDVKKSTQVIKKPVPRVPSPLYDTIEIDKVSSRPVVYLSDNIRKSNKVLSEESRKKSLVKNDSFRKFECNIETTEPVTENKSCKTKGEVKRIDNVNNDQSVIALKRINSFTKGGPDDTQSIIKLPRINSFKTADGTVKRSFSLKRSNSKKVESRDFLIVDKPSEKSTPEENKNGEQQSRTEDLIKNGFLKEDSKSQTNTLNKSEISSKDSVISTSSSESSGLENKNWDRMLQNKNHVNTLIDEMFASVLDVNDDANKKDANDNRIVIPNKIADNIMINTKSTDNLTVIVISDDSSDDNKSFSSSSKSNNSTSERKTKLNDIVNHELLIQELQNMKNDQKQILKRQRLPSLDIYADESIIEGVTVNSDDKIHTSDWYGVSEEGKEVRMSSCHITIEDAKRHKEWSTEESMNLDFDRISKMSQFHGLPPLPKSLSGFSFMEHHPHPNPPTPVRSSSIRSSYGPQLTPAHHVGALPHLKTNGDERKPSTLDAQLAILRREMYSLRQQDLSLLSQLWSLNESIQDFRQMLQDQEDRVLSPPSPSPTQSSVDDEEEYYMSAHSMGFRPSPMVSRKLSGSSGASGSIG